MAAMESSKAAEIAATVGELIAAAEGRAREEVAQRLASIMMQVDRERHPPPAVHQPMGFTAAAGLYSLNPDATGLEVQDQLAARLAQLRAMLTVAHGEGFESFDGYSGDVRENYLWACAMLAGECQELAGALPGKTVRAGVDSSGNVEPITD